MNWEAQGLGFGPQAQTSLERHRLAPQCRQGVLHPELRLISI